jgi:TonB family protein
MDLQISKFEIPKDEDGLLKVFIGASLFIHVIFIGIGVDSFLSTERAPIENEWEIEADLAVGIKGDGKVDSIDRSKKGDEIKVNKQILPQLTKSFEIERQKTKKVADLGETFVDPELQRETKKNSAAAKLKKREALRRLLKERARKNKKFADQTTSPIAKRLQARKRELEGKEFSLGSEKKWNRFVKEVQISIRRFYSLPEVYRSKSSNLKTVISVKLDRRGQILDIKVSESSGDKSFDDIGISTIKKAAPLPAPPKDLVGKSFVLNFNPTN